MTTPKTIDLTDSEHHKVTVTVHPVEKYSNKHPVVIETVTRDEYHDKWLEPRTTRILMSDDQLRRLSFFLS